MRRRYFNEANKISTKIANRKSKAPIWSSSKALWHPWQGQLVAEHETIGAWQNLLSKSEEKCGKLWPSVFSPIVFQKPWASTHIADSVSSSAMDSTVDKPFKKLPTNCFLVGPLSSSPFVMTCPQPLNIKSISLEILEFAMVSYGHAMDAPAFKTLTRKATLQAEHLRNKEHLAQCHGDLGKIGNKSTCFCLSCLKCGNKMTWPSAKEKCIIATHRK